MVWMCHGAYIYGRRASELCSVIMNKVAVTIMAIGWVVCSSIMNAEECDCWVLWMLHL